jgi:hypothetical protein
MNRFIELLRANRQAFEEQYNQRLSTDKRRAIGAMLSCQSSPQRASHWACNHCDHMEHLPLSCGHRHCPQCQHSTTSNWLARQQQKLLPVHYFMVTFTLPFELRALARAQPKALYQLMFSVSSSVLKDFSSRQHTGELGFTSVLHTHSRRREMHPHLHIIVTCGGYDSSRNVWLKGNKGYLFNEFSLAKVWRARMLERIVRHDNLSLPDHQTQPLPKKWVVDCQKVGYGLPALKYLSRYLYRGVLPDNDITAITNTTVTFKYKDSQTKTLKHRTLPTLKFLWLILQHVLPKGLQRVRDYGFLRGNAKAIRWKIMLILIRTNNWMAPVQQAIKRQIKRVCPCCQHEMSCVGVTRTI